MAAQEVTSPSSSGLSSAQKVHAENSSQASLDLNLTQRTSQNFVKGHDENEGSHRGVATEGKVSSPSKWRVEVPTTDGDGRASDLRFLQSATPPSQADQVPDTAGATLAANHNELPQSRVLGDENGALATNGSPPTASGRKRKGLRGAAAAAVKGQKEQHLHSGTLALQAVLPELVGRGKSPHLEQQSTMDATKKVILALEANDDEGVARPKLKLKSSNNDSKDLAVRTPRSRSSRARKGDEPSLNEERLFLLEERKIRLAEQRYILEEKKLQATIEIGRGLIFSMERMTSTIANLGFPSTHHL